MPSGPDSPLDPPAPRPAAEDTTPPQTVPLAPTPFQPASRPPPGAPRLHGRRRWLAWLVLTLLSVLLGLLWFVFTARQMELDIQPEPETLALHGGWPSLRFGRAYLLRPGTYRLEATRAGYHPLKQTLLVGKTPQQRVALTMRKLPGQVQLTVLSAEDPETHVSDAAVWIDDQPVGATPLEELTLEAGAHQVRIRAALYLEQEATVDVAGEGRHQALTVALTPNWAPVHFDSNPLGAKVNIEGRPLGTTPLTIPLAAGFHEATLLQEGFKPFDLRFEVQARRPLVLPTAQLERRDGILALDSTPQGATITAGDRFFGQTPMEIALAPDRPHTLRISKPGYATVERQVTLSAETRETLTIALAPRLGTVRFEVRPEDAELIVDGRSRGPVPKALNLLAVRHQIQIVKPGFREYAATITPRPGYPLALKIRLRRPNETETPGIIAAANGYRLQLVRPGPFQMGSSRAEPGRRANESQQTVHLTRPFYMGLHEVTNAAFRAFQANHDAGRFQSESLNHDDQPAVNLTWQQAAAFCNWLSHREGLAPVYIPQGEILVAQKPLGNGYRLPTEAEWAYCARFDPAGQTHRYPWGEGFPPPVRAANIADRSARGILENYLDNYEDGYPAAAPPGRFAPNPLGLHDLGGNVAEWCHDLYGIVLPVPGRIATDPTGADTGRLHVIRGGSWQQASPQTLRTAYRDYLEGRRADLGFRIARYADREGATP